MLLHCHAGCDVETILAALGLQLRDLFPERGEGGGDTSRRSRQHVNTRPDLRVVEGGEGAEGLTLAAYAEAKRLPVEFLRSIGLSEITYLGAPAVRIPYLDVRGHEIAVQFRVGLHGDLRFKWKKGAKPLLYGLHRLAPMSERGFLILVEGTSCAHTLWLHDYPALGLPGVGWNEDRDAAHLDGIDAVYVVIEPDRGGQALLDRLPGSRICERLHLVRLDGAKDVSELYLDDPSRFSERLGIALRASVPWDEHERIKRDVERHGAYQECERLARDPRILDRLAQDVGRLGLAGEERLVKLVYLALVSRLLTKIVSLVVKGPSSVGKSHVIAEVLRFFPQHAFFAHTGMSERALIFGEEDLRHRMLVLYEAEGLQEGLMAYVVRSLLSEGRLSYPITERGPDGVHRARTVVREGPTGLIVTTTLVKLHEENETRLLSLLADDSPAQTARILLSLAAEDERGDGVNFEAWQALQEWIENGDVAITVPFAKTLAELVPPLAVRLRRDFGAVLGLIRAHALLHQASRGRDAKGRVVAALDDYAIVRELVNDLVSDSVEATVAPTLRETVEAVRELLGEKKEEEEEATVSIRALGERLGIDKAAASRRWASARQRGYLKNLEEKRGKPARIMLGDPLPDDVELLPSREELAKRCGSSEGQEASSDAGSRGSVDVLTQIPGDSPILLPPEQNERALLAEVDELARADVLRRQNGPVGLTEPGAWYRAKCRAQARGVWRGQMTEAESARELAFWHAVFVQAGALDRKET